MDKAGQPGRFVLNPGTPDEREVPPAGENIPVKAGDLLRVETSGGGGWGDPFTREAQEVRRDVLEGFVSLQASLEKYGVVMRPDALEIDWPATESLRVGRKPSLTDVDRGPHGESWLRKLGVAE